MSNILYRTESAYGSGERDIVKVIAYEVFEMGNTDVLDYIGKSYMECFTDDFLTVLSYAGALSSYEEVEALVKKTIDRINEYYAINLRYCLWLASFQAVTDLYGGTEENIVGYEASKYILNDLGFDGRLYAYEKVPKPLPRREKVKWTKKKRQK